MMERWQNQQEAYNFAMSRPACMLDMEMGTGKTRVAIDVCMDREESSRILIVCPKAVIPVWRENLEKFRKGEYWVCFDKRKGTVKEKAKKLKEFLDGSFATYKRFVVVNYDSVWRQELGTYIYKEACFDTVILDESHRAKAAGSKVSKYLGMLGKKTRYRMCLSGTPMANSPLDVYGQYRFLDPNIFGTSYYLFQQQYAVMGGPDLKFVVAFKNQQDLNRKFKSIAYTCKMSEVADMIKLPDALPSMVRYVDLPTRDLKTIRTLSKEFVAECGAGHIVANNVLVKLLRIQQICSGFCYTKESVFDNEEIQELNTSKQSELEDILEDISPRSSVVVFCVFKHDIEAIRLAAKKSKRKCFELSGSINTLDEWKKEDGAVIAVQIQAGAEGVDMTKAHHAIYFSIPHSLALYNQSKARLYRPNQKHAVSFIHLIADGTVDQAMYKSLTKKEDIIDAIKAGNFDFGYIH